MILGSIAGLFSGLFSRFVAAKQNDAPADNGVLLTPTQRKAKLLNWFKTQTASGAPMACRIVVNCEWRIIGELYLKPGVIRQIGVGRDPDETDEMAEEFRVEFEKNCKRFCPSIALKVLTESFVPASYS
jgi:hypothetical protein